jgi:hypothetical protein
MDAGRLMLATAEVVAGLAVLAKVVHTGTCTRLAALKNEINKKN